MAGMAVRRVMWVGRARTFAFLVLALMVVALIGGLAAKPAHAKTFTVISTADVEDQTPDGTCDGCALREAIQEANFVAGADTINFAIPGTGPHTINVASALPKISKPVTIDGYSQSGATENQETQPGKTDASPKIRINGTDPGSNFISGLDIMASNVVVRGLVIDNFNNGGIRVRQNTDNVRIEGNFIGTDPGGTADLGNGYGVLLEDTTDNSTIGGTSPEARNLISGNLYGVLMQGRTSGNKIQGNLIGTDKTGTADLGNAVMGVFVCDACPNNTIGDSDPSDGATNAANTIAFNDDIGVFVNSEFSTGNRILSNSIFSNGGLGINLFGGTENTYGVTANDPRDQDRGANNLQNYPVLGALLLPGDTTIAGELNSTPSTRKKKRTFTIQFFSSPAADVDPSGYGEGKTYLGQIKVRTDRQGNATFNFFTQPLSAGQFITATATNNKTGDTSEFSEAREVKEPVIGGGG